MGRMERKKSTSFQGKRKSAFLGHGTTKVEENVHEPCDSLEEPEMVQDTPYLGGETSTA